MAPKIYSKRHGNKYIGKIKEFRSRPFSIKTALPGRMSSSPTEVRILRPYWKHLVLITSICPSDHFYNQTKSDELRATQVYSKMSSLVQDQAMTSPQRWRCRCHEKNIKPHTWHVYIPTLASSKFKRHYYTLPWPTISLSRAEKWEVTGSARSDLSRNYIIFFSNIAKTINKHGWYNMVRNDGVLARVLSSLSRIASDGNM